ncbi:MAG: His/Gly/Thr/Pro-type tRNA ligase C-terminal domain-containing protein, partial [Deltaproteobacteria bacterium]
LGQNFGKAFNVRFQSKEGALEHVWQTSWGVSTRLIGGLIMTHSDDAGLVLPPKLAPVHVVVIPIFKNPEEKSRVLEAGDRVKRDAEARGMTVVLDDRDELRPGAKHFEWEQKGVPVRVEIGPRDLDAGTCVLKRRDVGGKDKTIVPLEGVGAVLEGLMTEIQSVLLARAKAFRAAHTVKADTYEQFKAVLETGGIGNFVLAHWDGTPETEKKIKDDTRATIRCIPLESDGETGVCMVTGQPSAQRVVFARAY